MGEENDPHLPEGAADAVLIANTYHEFHNPRVMIGHVFRSLRPGGRLVVVDRGPRSPGADSSNSVAGSHEMPATVVEAQLRQLGIEIVHREVPFIDGPGGDPWWLIAARKP